jgi:5-methylcytosine-specific restriction endonuclease McrA
MRLPESNHYCEWHYFSDVAKSRLGKADKCTVEALRVKFYESNCLCPYTNKTLVLGVNASLDHKLPVSRYPEKRSSLDNVEWVSARANDAKGNLTTQEFIEFCHTVAKLNPID